MPRQKRPLAYMYRDGDKWILKHAKNPEWRETCQTIEEAKYMAKNFYGWRAVRFKPWDMNIKKENK